MLHLCHFANYLLWALLLRTVHTHFAHLRGHEIEIGAEEDHATIDEETPPLWHNCTGSSGLHAEDVGPVYFGEDVSKMVKLGTLHDPECAGKSSVLAVPSADMLRKAPYNSYLHPGTDGFCRLNEETTCSLATRAKDYMLYALAGASNSLQKSPCMDGYEADRFRIAPGVPIYDAKMCADNGFLDDPHVPWYDFEYLTKVASQKCQWLKSKFKNWNNWTFKGHKDLVIHQKEAMEKEAHIPYKSRKYKKPSKTEMFAHAMTKCAMFEPHGLACDMAYCLYNYCILDDGRIGMGKQCRPTWLSAKYIKKHTKSLKEGEIEFPVQQRDGE